MSQPYSVDDGSFCDCCYKLPVEKVKSSFHCISILNGLCIAFVGVMEIWAFGLNWTANDDVCKSTKCCLKWNTFSKIFLPVYTVIAGLLLVVAELRLQACHERLSGNCGFLFSYNFRVLYILLAGTLCFSMECSQYIYVGYIAGTISAMNAIFSCFMISNHPQMVELTGHDDIDNARLLQNYGHYAYKLHDEKPMRDGGMTPSETSAESLNMKAASSSEVDAYLNPFAADNSF